MCPCSKNLDSQEDYCAKIGTFWNIGNIGSRHVMILKLGLSGPRTNINTFRPILNHSEHFEKNVHFRSFLVIPWVILYDFWCLLGLAYGYIHLRNPNWAFPALKYGQYCDVPMFQIYEFIYCIFWWRLARMRFSVKTTSVFKFEIFLARGAHTLRVKF